MVYISLGRGWLETARRPRQTLEAGSVFLLFPDVWHRYRPMTDTGWREHWIGFGGSQVRRWAKAGFFTA